MLKPRLPCRIIFIYASLAFPVILFLSQQKTLPHPSVTFRESHTPTPHDNHHNKFPPPNRQTDHNVSLDDTQTSQSNHQGEPEQSETKAKKGPQQDEISQADTELSRVDTERSVTQLPPRLTPSLVQFKQSPDNPLTEPYEWKSPAMLTVLGIPEEQKLKLAMFSTGVDLIGFHRCFTFIGCLVGNKTYPRMVEDQRTPHFCLVDPEIPHGTEISLLLRRDEIIETAIEKPLVDGEFIFENHEHDFIELDENVVIDDEVRELAGVYEIVTIQSNVTWHEGLREAPFDPEEKKYELCLMTAMRQYPFLMQEWFDYYRQVGVDQIYVYDNVATEDLSQFDSEFVQTAFWPFSRSQHQSFNHFLLLSKNRCKYVGFFDADEYAFVGEIGPIALKRYIKKRFSDGYDQVTFPFIVMAGGGYIELPEGLLPELYVRRNLRQEKYHVGKSIIISEAKWKRHGTHAANGGRKMYKNSSFELNPTSFEHNGMLVHYTKRSWEEFIMKLNTGGASVVTNARAPQNATMDRIPKYYLSNDSTVEYTTFRDRWRVIMNLPEPRGLTLAWRSNDKECTQQYFAASNGTDMGEITCN